MRPDDLAPLDHLLRLFHNRNLGLGGTARTLAVLTPVYLAVSTYKHVQEVGNGLTALTPQLVTASASVLGIPADVLAALVEVDLPDAVEPPDPLVREVAELLWDLRSLTADQVRRLDEPFRP